MEAELLERLQPITEGLTRGSSADVAIPPPAILPFAHAPVERTSNKAGGKHNFSFISAKTQNCEVCRRTKDTRPPCRRNPDDRADRVKIAERFGDVITADHKVVSEEQESRLHHRCAVVVQDLATQRI